MNKKQALLDNVCIKCCLLGTALSSHTMIDLKEMKFNTKQKQTTHKVDKVLWQPLASCFSAMKNVKACRF